jgi:uncharacterized protein YigE (DUF2233 family)
MYANYYKTGFYPWDEGNFPPTTILPHGHKQSTSPYLHPMKLSHLFISLCLLSCSNPGTDKLQQKAQQTIQQVQEALEPMVQAKDYIGYEADSGSIRMFWKDSSGTPLGSLGKLKRHIEQQGGTLLYACNGGMYMENQAPLGYYIENGNTLQKINTRTGSGNFYLQPKGVFYMLANGKAAVQSIETAADRKALPANIRYLTQSGPMLINKGRINPLFQPSSDNVNIRNGVGILPNGHAYFAMSARPVNFYGFAKHFADKGCQEALYFDGFVSRTYCPTAGCTQTGGAFGVMVAVVD